MEKHQVLTVLVADDEPELLGAVCQLIDWESLGFRLVGRAGNGLDALQLVEALQPDFLLTDIRMPFISGTALTRQAKAVQPLLQVAFLSGYDDFEYAKAGIEDEIVAYLLKPISMAERIFSRAFSCCGFSSGDRTVLLLASGNGFGRLYASLDELRQATRRALGAEALAGLSKEYASLGEGHTAYLEAMEALKIARRGGGLYAAGGWDDMAMLCARALKIIEKEYMDEELSLQSVSERLHISANYLGANIKKFYGDTFMNLLIKKRMDVALKLLWSGSSRIAEVSRRCGYADQSYFGYCFKKYYGKSPARMRQEQKEANA